MQHNNTHGELLNNIFIQGYPVAIYLSNVEHENNGNQITTQLVQAYEERKKFISDSLDILCVLPYHN